MMDEQQLDTTHGTTSGRPEDALTTQDIVSAGQRTHTASEGEQEGRLRRDRASVEDGRNADARTGADTRTDAGARMDADARRDADARTGGVPTRAAKREDHDITSPTPLLSSEATGAYQARWDAIQTAFVDEPRRVVEQADGLVAEMMQRLAETFAHERANLERHWDQGGNVSTEELRLALQRYRSFFQRLLST